MRRRGAALVLGLLVAMAGAEVTLRLAGMGFGNSPMEPDPYLHHVHPKNYRFVQQHPSGELGGSPHRRLGYGAPVPGGPDGRLVHRGRTGAV